MKTYRVSWTETEAFNTEVTVGDYATEDDIINEAARARDHGRVWVDPWDRNMEMENVVVEEVDSEEDDEEEDEDV